MKSLLLFLTVFINLQVFAQPELVGLINSEGAYHGGTIVHYSGGSQSIAQKYDLPDSAGPAGSLIQASNGKMYGLTRFDGPTNEGTLFEYDYLTNTYTVMVNFHGITGYSPQASLLEASDGKLYGMTWQGGADSGGTLFSYTIGAHSVNVLHSFSASNYSLCTPIQSKNGRIYGMSRGDGANGGGAKFSYDISTSTFHTDYDLPANAIPYNSLLETDTSVLYGLSYYDGANGGGTLFRYVANARTNPYTVLHDFQASDHPRGSLIQASDGKLYGGVGGASSGDLGYLFSYDLGTSTFATIYNFTGGVNGSSPYGTVFQASDGLLYGTTYFGGAYSHGTIFQYDINQHSYLKNVDLDSITGCLPLHGHFIEYNANHTAIQEVAESDVKVYGKIKAIAVERNSSETSLTIIISDLLGRDIINISSFERNIDLPIDNSNSIYLVRLKENGKESVRKVFVK